MRDAAHRQDDEAPPEPPARDLTAEAGALLDHARALLPVLKARGDDRAAMETVILGLRIAELASAMEDTAAGEAVVAAAYAQGRADEAAARDEAEAGRRSSRPRHAARGHLRVAGGAAVRAGAVAAAVAGATTVIAAHDSASVHHVALPRPAAVRLHEAPPDSAVPFPSRSPSPHPSAAVASARPAPSVTAVPPSVPPAPVRSSSPPPPPAPPAPSLLVSVRNLGLSGTTGTFTITATDRPVDWWVSTDIPGASVTAQAGGRQGVLSPGQEPVTITVTAPPGESGFVYVKWDGGGIASVWVTSSLGVPALALPSGL